MLAGRAAITCKDVLGSQGCLSDRILGDGASSLEPQRNRMHSMVSLPLVEDDEGLFRLYLSDPGMFVHQSGVPQSDFMVRDKRNSLAGVFYESYVADELTAKGVPLFYWTGKRSHELEFIVESGGYAVPIDVKKGRGRMNSLDEFRLHNPHTIAVKVHAGNFGYDVEHDILSIPLYAAFALAEDIAQGKALSKKG